jgi:hypothetical protein
MAKELFDENPPLEKPLGSLGGSHVPEWSDLPKKPHLESDPEFAHLFVEGHIAIDVIEKFKKVAEPNPSYVKLSPPTQPPGLSGKEEIAVRSHFLRCEECRKARDGSTLF